MFGLFSHSNRKSASAKSNAQRPMLEKLEDRDCPSTITLTTYFQPSTKSQFWGGQVTDTPSPGNLTVQLSGVVNATTTTNSNGYFMVYLQVSGLGTAYAATTDGQSNTAEVTLTDAASQIDQFSWVEYSGGMAVFSGHVTGGYQGEVVTFGGISALQGQTTTVNSNGNFTLCAMLNGQMSNNGDATAQAADAWAVTSNLATTWVSQT